MRNSMRKLIPWWGMLLIGLIAMIIGSHLLFEDAISAYFNNALTAFESHPIIAALIVSGFSLDILLPIPASFLSVWAVVALGFIGGFVTIWVGMSLACVIAYGLGTCASAPLLQKFIKPEDLIKAQTFNARYGLWALVLLRPVPILAETSVIIAGLLKAPFRQYLLLTSLSNAGIAFVYAGIGTALNVQSSFAAAILASITLPAIAWGIAKLAGYSLWQSQSSTTPQSTIVQPSFNIKFSYPLCFTENVFALDNKTLIDQLDSNNRRKQIKVLFIADRNVLKTRHQLKQEIADYCNKHGLDWAEMIFELPGGEAAKTQAHVDAMQQQMLDRQLDRQSYVIAIGGGAVLDAAGYAAATFHRGVRLIRMPTTVLAQNDAGVGVKNGINSHAIKNLLGCFTLPHAVINDWQFLCDLSTRDFRCGFAEAVKVGLIRDGAFFNWIADNVTSLNQRDAQAVQYLIKHCASLHLRQICEGGDPFETGNARPLDYGHWSAHKLETLSNHRLTHGEAVAIGIALDALYAVEIGLLNQTDAETIINVLNALGFTLWHASLLTKTATGENALLNGLEEFRQHLGGELCITLLSGIGSSIEVHSMQREPLLLAREKLFAYYRQQSQQYKPASNLHEINTPA